jgi:hypothetical protein
VSNARMASQLGKPLQSNSRYWVKEPNTGLSLVVPSPQVPALPQHQSARVGRAVEPCGVQNQRAGIRRPARRFGEWLACRLAISGESQCEDQGTNHKNILVRKTGKNRVCMSVQFHVLPPWRSTRWTSIQSDFGICSGRILP